MLEYISGFAREFGAYLAVGGGIAGLVHLLNRHFDPYRLLEKDRGRQNYNQDGERYAINKLLDKKQLTPDEEALLISMLDHPDYQAEAHVRYR